MGIKQSKNVPPLEREIRYFLYDLCVDWGFCIPPDDADRIATKKRYDAREFAIDVLEAEGLKPEYEKKFVRDISAWFYRRFETDEIDEESFIDRPLRKHGD